VSIATPLASPGFAVHGFNISFPVTGDDAATLEARYAPLLLHTADRVRTALAARRSEQDASARR
jgi:hypothetical protein